MSIKPKPKNWMAQDQEMLQSNNFQKPRNYNSIGIKVVKGRLYKVWYFFFKLNFMYIIDESWVGDK